MSKKNKKKVSKKVVSRANKVSHELVVRVEPTQPTAVIPTVSDLAEPMKDGKSLTMQKTWLSSNQLLRMLQATPKEQVYKRKGRGGKEFDYVTGSYCVKWLNFNFGWNWEYESVNEPTASDIISLISNKINQIWVTGKLTVHSPDGKYSIVKMQSGSSELKMTKDNKPMDIGDDMKSAHTDALKKCASLLGFASDIYGKAVYKQESGKDPHPEPVAMPVIDHGAENQDPTQPLKPGQIIDQDGKPAYACETCGDPISDAGAALSQKITGKRLCKEHYDEAVKKKK